MKRQSLIVSFQADSDDSDDSDESVQAVPATNCPAYLTSSLPDGQTSAFSFLSGDKKSKRAALARKVERRDGHACVLTGFADVEVSHLFKTSNTDWVRVYGNFQAFSLTLVCPGPGAYYLRARRAIITSRQRIDDDQRRLRSTSSYRNLRRLRQTV